VQSHLIYRNEYDASCVSGEKNRKKIEKVAVETIWHRYLGPAGGSSAPMVLAPKTIGPRTNLGRIRSVATQLDPITVELIAPTSTESGLNSMSSH